VSCARVGPSSRTADETAPEPMAAVVRKTLARVLAQAVVRRRSMQEVPSRRGPEGCRGSRRGNRPVYLEGSHSCAMHCSSFTASTASLEVALVGREDGLDGMGRRFYRCPKRLTVFATDWRSRSSVAWRPLGRSEDRSDGKINMEHQLKAGSQEQK
jgi:hypothetical protein